MNGQASTLAWGHLVKTKSYEKKMDRHSGHGSNVYVIGTLAFSVDDLKDESNAGCGWLLGAGWSVEMLERVVVSVVVSGSAGWSLEASEGLGWLSVGSGFVVWVAMGVLSKLMRLAARLDLFIML